MKFLDVTSHVALEDGIELLHVFSTLNGNIEEVSSLLGTLLMCGQCFDCFGEVPDQIQRYQNIYS